jgi:hypothetical protein
MLYWPARQHASTPARPPSPSPPSSSSKWSLRDADPRALRRSTRYVCSYGPTAGLATAHTDTCPPTSSPPTSPPTPSCVCTPRRRYSRARRPVDTGSRICHSLCQPASPPVRQPASSSQRHRHPAYRNRTGTSRSCGTAARSTAAARKPERAAVDEQHWHMAAARHRLLALLASRIVARAACSLGQSASPVQSAALQYCCTVALERPLVVHPPLSDHGSHW